MEEPSPTVSVRGVVQRRIAETKARQGSRQRSPAAPYDAAVSQLSRPEYTDINIDFDHVADLVNTAGDESAFDVRVETVRQRAEAPHLATSSRVLHKRRSFVQVYVNMLAAKICLAKVLPTLPKAMRSKHPVVHRRQFEDWANTPGYTYLEEYPSDLKRLPMTEDRPAASDPRAYTDTEASTSRRSSGSSHPSGGSSTNSTSPRDWGSKSPSPGAQAPTTRRRSARLTPSTSAAPATNGRANPSLIVTLPIPRERRRDFLQPQSAGNSLAANQPAVPRELRAHNDGRSTAPAAILARNAQARTTARRRRRPSAYDA